MKIYLRCGYNKEHHYVHLSQLGDIMRDRKVGRPTMHIRRVTESDDRVLYNVEDKSYDEFIRKFPTGADLLMELLDYQEGIPNGIDGVELNDLEADDIHDPLMDQREKDSSRLHSPLLDPLYSALDVLLLLKGYWRFRRGFLIQPRPDGRVPKKVEVFAHPNFTPPQERVIDRLLQHVEQEIQRHTAQVMSVSENVRTCCRVCGVAFRRKGLWENATHEVSCQKHRGGKVTDMADRIMGRIRLTSKRKKFAAMVKELKRERRRSSPSRKARSR